MAHSPGADAWFWKRRTFLKALPATQCRHRVHLQQAASIAGFSHARGAVNFEGFVAPDSAKRGIAGACDECDASAQDSSHHIRQKRRIARARATDATNVAGFVAANRAKTRKSG